MTTPVKNAYWVLSDKSTDSNGFVHPELVYKKTEMTNEEMHIRFGEDMLKIISDSWLVKDD